jgi:hypothetical protein
LTGFLSVGKLIQNESKRKRRDFVREIIDSRILTRQAKRAGIFSIGVNTDPVSTGTGGCAKGRFAQNRP